MNNIAIGIGSAVAAIITLLATIILLSILYFNKNRLIQYIKDKKNPPPLNPNNLPSFILKDPYVDVDNIPMFLEEGNSKYKYDYYKDNFIIKTTDIIKYYEGEFKELNIPKLLIGILTSYHSNSLVDSHYCNIKHLGDMIINSALATEPSYGPNNFAEKSSLSGMPNEDHFFLKTIHEKNRPNNIAASSDLAKKLRNTYISNLMDSPHLMGEFKSLPMTIQGLLLGILKLTDSLLANLQKVGIVCHYIEVDQYNARIKPICKAIVKYLRTNKLWYYTDAKDDKEYNECRQDWELLLNKYFPDHQLMSFYDEDLKKPDASTMLPVTKNMLSRNILDFKAVGGYIQDFTVIPCWNDKKPDALLNDSPQQISKRRTYLEQLIKSIHKFYSYGAQDLENSDDISSIFIKSAKYKDFENAIKKSGGTVIPDAADLSSWYLGNDQDATDLGNKHFMLYDPIKQINSKDLGRFLSKSIHTYGYRSYLCQGLLLQYIMAPNPSDEIKDNFKDYFKNYVGDDNPCNLIIKNKPSLNLIFNILLSKIKPAIDILQAIEIYQKDRLYEGSMHDDLNGIKELKNLAILVLGHKTQDNGHLNVQDRLQMLQGMLMDYILSLDISQILKDCKREINNDENLFSEILDIFNQLFIKKSEIRKKSFKDYTDVNSYNKRAEDLLKQTIMTTSGTMMSNIVRNMHRNTKNIRKKGLSMQELSICEETPNNLELGRNSKSTSAFMNMAVIFHTEKRDDNYKKYEIEYQHALSPNIPLLGKKRTINSWICFLESQIKEKSPITADDFANSKTLRQADKNDSANLLESLKKLYEYPYETEKDIELRRKKMDSRKANNIPGGFVSKGDRYSIRRTIDSIQDLKKCWNEMKIDCKFMDINAIENKLKKNDSDAKKLREFFDNTILFKIAGLDQTKRFGFSLEINRNLINQLYHINNITESIMNKKELADFDDEEKLDCVYLRAFQAICTGMYIIFQNEYDLPEHIISLPKKLYAQFLEYHENNPSIQKALAIYPLDLQNFHSYKQNEKVTCNDKNELMLFAKKLTPDLEIGSTYLLGDREFLRDDPVFPMLPRHHVLKNKTHKEVNLPNNRDYQYPIDIAYSNIKSDDLESNPSL